MGTERLKRIDTMTPPAGEDHGEEGHVSSDLWALERPSYDHMTQVAREARNLLGALGANVDWLKSVLPEQPPMEDLTEGLSDIETCCERLRDLLEDALIGARKEGLSVNRAIVSLGSMLTVCVRQVKRRAAFKQIAFEVVENELYAMLDGSLLMRAVVRLLDRAIQQVEKGAVLQLRYGLDDEEIRITIGRRDASVRSLPPPGSPRAPSSLRPPSSMRPPTLLPASLRPPRPMKDVGNLSDELEFCRLAVEAHGGTLTVGGSALYRISLPLVETKLRR